MRRRRVTDHGIRPLISLCKQKQTLFLYVQQMVNETHQIGLWTSLLQQVRLGYFEIMAVYSPT